MTMYKALQLNDNVDRPYMSKKEGERGLTSIEIALMHRYKDLKTT